jgi:hypothetical protein
VIEVTDEMVYAYAGEPEITGTDAHAIRVGLAAVLAIVERANADQVQREWDALEYCPSMDPGHPGWRCEQQAGHEGQHRAMRWQLEWA